MKMTCAHESEQDYRIQSSKPIVTALICNYNYERYLGDAIISALAQTWKNIEILVVDDGSTDASREVLKRFEGRIRIIFKDNGGQASAFNTGIAETRGEIICFLDSDDTWNPEKVERVVAKYMEAPWGLVCHDLAIIDDQGNSLDRANWTEFSGIRLRSGDLLKKLVDEGYPWVFCPTSGMSIPTSIARQLLPLPEAEWRICADNPIAYGAVHHAPVGVIEEPLGFYRIHGKNGFALTYHEIVSGLVFSVIHPARRYFFLRKRLNSLGKVLSKTPKDNYRYYRRFCFIACKYPWRNFTRLVKMNLSYFSQKRSFFAPFLSASFLVMDILTLLSIHLNLPGKYKKARMRFEAEAHGLDPLIKTFLMDQ